MNIVSQAVPFAQLAQFWNHIQSRLFPYLEQQLEEALSPQMRQLVATLEIVRVEEHVPSPHQQHLGRPQHDRRAIARAFVAKAVLDVPTTKDLRAMLLEQTTLRQICGWERRNQVPSEAVFCRVFRDFTKTSLGDRVHAALVDRFINKETQIVMHISRDSTAITAREKAIKKEKPAKNKKSGYPRGRPKAGEERPAKEVPRLQRQLTQTIAEALSELPTVCSFGCKGDSSGARHMQFWKGYKTHIDWADGSIPVNVVTTSASLNDSQAAIPMARRTAERVTSLYDLMDCAYDAAEIRQVSSELGHMALIAPHPTRKDPIRLTPAGKVRFRERTTAERGNSRLKDEFGCRHVRVRGHAKVHLHVMFGVLALFADQLLKPPKPLLG